MTIFASGALLQALLLAAAGVGQPTSEQAGAALSAGRLDEAAAGAESCLPDPGCALVRGRALFALGRLADAAQALQGARTGNLAAHAAKLQGEAFVLAGRPADALEPLRAAARAEEARLSEVSGRPLPEPSGRELLLRAQRLLSAGKPGAAVAQAEAAVKALRGGEAAEAQLTLARALAADGRR